MFVRRSCLTAPQASPNSQDNGYPDDRGVQNKAAGARGRLQEEDMRSPTGVTDGISVASRALECRLCCM